VKKICDLYHFQVEYQFDAEQHRLELVL
jgi:hypothetical protein